MATELKMSEINRAFTGGTMAVDVLLDGIIGQDVELELDAPAKRDVVEWLFRVGAKSVTIPRNAKARWSCWVTPELWADKPALESVMSAGIDGWAREQGLEPDGPLLIHELRRSNRSGLLMIEAAVLRRYRLKRPRDDQSLARAAKMLIPENTICGRCGKTCADNVPLEFRTETECRCAPASFGRAPAPALAIRTGRLRYSIWVEYFAADVLAHPSRLGPDSEPVPPRDSRIIKRATIATFGFRGPWGGTRLDPAPQPGARRK